MNSRQRRKAIRKLQREIQQAIMKLLKDDPPWMPIDGTPYLLRISDKPAEDKEKRISPKIELLNIPPTFEFRPGETFDECRERIGLPKLG